MRDSFRESVKRKSTEAADEIRDQVEEVALSITENFEEEAA